MTLPSSPQSRSMEEQEGWLRSQTAMVVGLDWWTGERGRETA